MHEDWLKTHRPMRWAFRQFSAERRAERRRMAEFKAAMEAAKIERLARAADGV